MYGDFNPELESTATFNRWPAPDRNARPERWQADYNRPIVYDRENWKTAMSGAGPVGEHYGPVEWGRPTRAGGTAMNPRYIDERGMPPGIDRSSARLLGPGHFAGRGPRNWRRPDDRIREDVCEALTVHPMIDAHDLDVTVRDGDVTIAGTVPDRRSKRLAADVAESVAGVRDVTLEVRTQPSAVAPGPEARY